MLDTSVAASVRSATLRSPFQPHKLDKKWPRVESEPQIFSESGPDSFVRLSSQPDKSYLQHKNFIIDVRQHSTVRQFQFNQLRGLFFPLILSHSGAALLLPLIGRESIISLR